MKRIAASLILAVGIVLVSLNCRPEISQSQAQWTPLPWIKPQAWPSKTFNGHSRSKKKFIYYSHPKFHSEPNPKGQTGKFQIVSGELFPAPGTEQFRLLARKMVLGLNKNRRYDPVPVSIAVSADRLTLSVSYDYTNSYYPSERIEPVLGDFYGAEFINVHGDERAKTYWSGPWRITFDPKRYRNTKGASHWVVWSAITRPFRAEMYEGPNEQGVHELFIQMTLFRGPLPSQNIRIALHNGQPRLLSLTFDSYAWKGRVDNPEDWFGNEFGRYISDLPPEIRRYLTPSIVAQIAEEAAKRQKASSALS